jgi:hypothetical protein
MEKQHAGMITSAVANWAQSTYETQDIFIGQAAEDDSEDDEAKRILVDFAVRHVGHWLVAEVWLQNGTILGVNDLGEGLPLDNVEWPWPEDEIA